MITGKEYLKKHVGETNIPEEHFENEIGEIMDWYADDYYQEQVKNLSLSGVVATLPQDPIVLARYMHDAYEMLAKNNDWNTQENCKVDFSDLPIGNKNTMILLAGKLILDFGGN